MGYTFLMSDYPERKIFYAGLNQEKLSNPKTIMISIASASYPPFITFDNFARNPMAKMFLKSSIMGLYTYAVTI